MPVNRIVTAAGFSTTSNVARLVFGLAALVLCGCSKPRATPEQCKAAITRMMEIQLDSPDFQKAVGQGAPGVPGANLQEGTEWLKSQIPSMVTPQFVEQCVERFPRHDAECTLSATTTDQLINACHWKVVPGGRGAGLGF